MPEHGRRMFGVTRSQCMMALVFAALSPGCDERKVHREQATATIQGQLIKIRHDFGRIVKSNGEPITHNFEILNNTSHEIRLVEVVNNKTCCGDVENLGPDPIPAGERAVIRVSLKASSVLGPISHFSSVTTDDPAASKYELWTSATILPDLRIDVDGYEIPKLRRGERVPLRYRAVSYGSGPVPAVDLDRLHIRCDLDAHWDGPTVRRVSSDGISESTRGFTVSLEGGVDPGARTASMALMSGGTALLEYPLRWTVDSAIQAVPPGIVANGDTGTQEFTVLLKARDNLPFSLKPIGTMPEGIEVERPEASSALHKLLFRITPGESVNGKTATVMIGTDHPGQPEVPVSICVIGGKASIAGMGGSR